MKTPITIFVCLLVLSIPSQAAEQNQDNNGEQLNTQKVRLQNIHDTASRERETIENRYLEGLAQLRQEALQRAREIRLRDRMLWTEFISETYQRYYAENYIYGTPPLYYDVKALKLRRDMTDNYFLNMVADFLIDTDARKLLTDRDIINDYIRHDSQATSLRREAQKLLDVMNYFAAISEHLENQRARELTNLQIWEESSIAEVRKTVPPAEATPYGTVIAVIGYDEGSFCMIEGIDELIKAGDTINDAQTKNVKIVKIDTDKAKVEFKGNGQQWVQAVGQSPEAGWK